MLYEWFVFVSYRRLVYNRFLDPKPVNMTRFTSFATVIGFNETKIEAEVETTEANLLSNLLSNFEGSIEPNLNAMAEMTAALERLLVLPSFTNEQANHIFNIVDQLVDVTEQIDNDNGSLKKITNK